LSQTSFQEALRNAAEELAHDGERRPAILLARRAENAISQRGLFLNEGRIAAKFLNAIYELWAIRRKASIRSRRIA